MLGALITLTLLLVIAAIAWGTTPPGGDARQRAGGALIIGGAVGMMLGAGMMAVGALMARSEKATRLGGGAPRKAATLGGAVRKKVVARGAATPIAAAVTFKPSDLVQYKGYGVTAGEKSVIMAVEAAGVQPASALPVTIDSLPTTVPYRSGKYTAQGTSTRRGRHFGQRKLLLGEVDFLAEFARDGDTVVYAGAAPGIHVPFLAMLFPGVRFELYDPRKFDLRGTPTVLARITPHREFFTEETAASYAGRDDVLFISDVRTGTEDAVLPSEAEIIDDMRQQETWVRAMQPRAFSLKFRLPFDQMTDFEYFAGETRTQAWAPGASLETRLMASRPYTRRAYSPSDYDSRMNYLNLVVRPWAKYEPGVPLVAVPGLARDFDSALEAHIWAKYLRRNGGSSPSPAAIAALFNKATAEVHRGLDAPQRLAARRA